jgi:hypothetical protein
MKKCVALSYNTAMHFFIIKSIWKSAWRYVISWRTFSYGFYNKKVRCDLWPNVLWLVVICTYDQGHLKILYDLRFDRFDSVQVGSSRFKSVRVGSIQFESVRVGSNWTAPSRFNRSDWAEPNRMSYFHL